LQQVVCLSVLLRYYLFSVDAGEEMMNTNRILKVGINSFLGKSINTINNINRGDTNAVGIDSR